MSRPELVFSVQSLERFAELQRALEAVPPSTPPTPLDEAINVLMDELVILGASRAELVGLG